MAARHARPAKRRGGVAGPLAVVALCALAWVVWTGTQQPEPTPAPPPAAEAALAWVVWTGTQQPEPTPAPPPAAEAPAPQPDAPFIPNGRPVELYIPSIGLNPVAEKPRAVIDVISDTQGDPADYKLAVRRLNAMPQTVSMSHST